MPWVLSASWLGDSSCYSEGLKTWLFLCHSEWSLVQKSFSVVSYRPVGLAWPRWYSHLRCCILLLLNFLSSSSGTFPALYSWNLYLPYPSATSLPNLVFNLAAFFSGKICLSGRKYLLGVSEVHSARWP